VQNCFAKFQDIAARNKLIEKFKTTNMACLHITWENNMDFILSLTATQHSKKLIFDGNSFTEHSSLIL
jgi:hypothetical protein